MVTLDDPEGGQTEIDLREQRSEEQKQEGGKERRAGCA